MTVLRGSLQELCDVIENKPDAVLGNKFFDTRLVALVDFSHKSDKYEPRFFVISKFRIFLLTGKSANSLKIDRSFHVLNIKSICVVSENETALIVEDGGRKRILVRAFPADELALALLRTLRHYFSDIVPLLPRLVELHPADLYEKANQLVMDVSPRPCHSFRRTYAALCDLHDQPYRDEVAWDVEKIYTANRITDLRLEDFSHLTPKDLLPIVAVLQYSSYFDGLVIDGIRVQADMVEVLLGVIRHTKSLKRLVLSNCGLTREFPALLGAALAENAEGMPLEALDLSKNATLDDRKGFGLLSSSLARLPCLSALSLAECALSEKSTSTLCAALYAGLSGGAGKGLVHINFSANVIKDDLSSLVNLLSLSTSLRTLDLTDCHTPLERLWPALKYGCLQLERLILAGCTVSTGKKASPESLAAAKDFFAASVSLSVVDLSRVPLTAELLKAALLGLAGNNQLDPFSLILDGAVDARLGSTLEEGLPGVRAATVSLRDTNLEAEMPGVIQALARMPCLRVLLIGGQQVTSLKRNAKHASVIYKAVNELVKMVTTSQTLEELSLADGHLGNHISYLVNSLGAWTNLRILDLTSNDLGNVGARILSKALSLNTSLRRLHLDGNHTGTEGLADLATALEFNLTLTALPTPIGDIAEGIQRGDKAKVLSSWARIESALERNRSGHKVYEAARKRAGSRRAPDVADQVPTDEAISEFIQRVRTDAGKWIREHVGSSAASNDAHNKAEKVALGGLEEAVRRDLYASLTEWCWREMNAARDGDKASGGGGGGGGTGTGERKAPLVTNRSGTPASECASPSPAYRPRSILTECKTDADSLLDMLGPPQPSSLSHPSKGRPKPLRRKVIQGSIPPTATIDEDCGRSSSPTDSLGSSSAENRSTDRVPSRIAMLPPPLDNAGMGGGGGAPSPPSTSPLFSPGATVFNGGSTIEAPPSPVGASPSPGHSPLHSAMTTSMMGGGGGSGTESPPALPRRHVAVPPSLPPKPDKLTSRESSRDESPSAASRRSVADMARLFNR